MTGAADIALVRAKMPCCTDGIMAPRGWLERIVVRTTFAHEAVVATPAAA